MYSTSEEDDDLFEGASVRIRLLGGVVDRPITLSLPSLFKKVRCTALRRNMMVYNSFAAKCICRPKYRLVSLVVWCWLLFFVIWDYGFTTCLFLHSMHPFRSRKKSWVSCVKELQSSERSTPPSEDRIMRNFGEQPHLFLLMRELKAGLRNLIPNNKLSAWTKFISRFLGSLTDSLHY